MKASECCEHREGPCSFTASKVQWLHGAARQGQINILVKGEDQGRQLRREHGGRLAVSWSSLSEATTWVFGLAQMGAGREAVRTRSRVGAWPEGGCTGATEEQLVLLRGEGNRNFCVHISSTSAGLIW